MQVSSQLNAGRESSEESAEGVTGVTYQAGGGGGSGGGGGGGDETSATTGRHFIRQCPFNSGIIVDEKVSHQMFHSVHGVHGHIDEQ